MYMKDLRTEDLETRIADVALNSRYERLQLKRVSKNFLTFALGIIILSFFAPGKNGTILADIVSWGID